MTETTDISWTHHEDRPGSEDALTVCLRFEAIIDPVYGHYTVSRTDDAPVAAGSDDEICQVRHLGEVIPHIKAYLARCEPATPTI